MWACNWAIVRETAHPTFQQLPGGALQQLPLAAPPLACRRRHQAKLRIHSHPSGLARRQKGTSRQMLFCETAARPQTWHTHVSCSLAACVRSLSLDLSLRRYCCTWSSACFAVLLGTVPSYLDSLSAPSRTACVSCVSSWCRWSSAGPRAGCCTAAAAIFRLASSCCGW